MEGSREHEAVEQAALAWVMALNDAPADPQVRSALQGWLAASPTHRAAYEEACRVWQLTGLALPLSTPPADPAAPGSGRPAEPGVRDA